ncbi:hypothetical protein A3Q56_01189 [Intoshia linei]|uniref:Uncharacterized protein n=1 Tax=Intoshia linei TaxID=1819745 RepID=A0A177BA63_9BILA|nr:hypothetical protein A3Q56_01189 [Intoshia linei]
MSECSTLYIDSGLDEQFENDKIIIDTSVIKTTPNQFIHSLQIVEKFLYEKEKWNIIDIKLIQYLNDHITSNRK